MVALILRRRLPSGKSQGGFFTSVNYGGGRSWSTNLAYLVAGYRPSGDAELFLMLLSAIEWLKNVCQDFTKGITPSAKTSAASLAASKREHSPQPVVTSS